MTKEIKVGVREVGKELYLSKDLGEGTLGDTKFKAILRLPDHSIIVEVGEKNYIVESQDIISAVVEFHDQSKK